MRYGLPVWVTVVFLAGAAVALGDEAEQHWAYRSLTKPLIPSVNAAQWSNWARQPIDEFVLDRQLSLGLHPSKEADRLTWLRRVSFDLIGLPPTLVEMRRFVADRRADAYERVVERLLGSPRYGERWARHWMDLVHYAESHGHDQDRPRDHAWPYRDYLIRALNQDVPYARFVQEQIAGDVIFPEDPWAIVGTGFLATGPWDESSLRDIRPDSIDRLVGQYIDRDDIVATTFSTFLSSSVHCARCHDHKFDPISQREYYELQAVFAGTDKGNRPFDWDSHVADERRRLQARLATIEKQISQNDPSLLSARHRATLRQWEYEYDRDRIPWRHASIDRVETVESSSLERLEDDSFLATGEAPEKELYSVYFGGNAREITGLRLEVMSDPSLPHRGPGRNAENGNFHLNEVRLYWQAESSDEWARVPLAEAQASFEQKGYEIAHSIDDKDESAWGIHPEEGRDHFAQYSISKEHRQAGEGNYKLELEQIHGRQHVIGRFRLSVTSTQRPLKWEQLPSEVELALQSPWQERTDEQLLTLTGWLARRIVNQSLADLPQQSLVYSGTSHFTPDGSFVPAAEPRVIHVLDRGDVLKPKDEVSPGALSFQSGLSSQLSIAEPASDGDRRRALATWLTSDANAILWRSIVNRVWLHHFGRGLVGTPNDFGTMGEDPSHPELLEWLAATFRDRGGHLKDLHRMIVLSATYRQVADYDSAQAQADADNRFLWRANRRRLDAESIRDAMLAISNGLDTRMGGESDRQFIATKGVHVTPNLDYVNFDPTSPANARRSVYRFVFRTVPDPFMEAMDCPDASLLSPQRQESLTALQALAVLNDKFVIRRSEELEQRLLRAEPDATEQIQLAFRLLFGRSADAEELEAVKTFATSHGLANACRFLLNSNEFIFVN